LKGFNDMPGVMRFKGRGGRTQKEPGMMNRLEASYAIHLDDRKCRGEIADWRYEKFKMQLAKRTSITIDFAVMLADGTIEFHETKGFMEEDANVKLKVIAEDMWWFRFRLVRAIPKKDGGGFKVTEIGG
jgi:hypothetical protein